MYKEHIVIHVAAIWMHCTIACYTLKIIDISSLHVEMYVLIYYLFIQFSIFALPFITEQGDTKGAYKKDKNFYPTIIKIL